MKIGYLGVGAWGYAVGSLLAEAGHEVIAWTNYPQIAEYIWEHGEHPKLKGFPLPRTMRVTKKLEEALHKIDILLEAVTAEGLRPVLQEVREKGIPECPFVITSKGIEQNTGMILPEVAREIWGKKRSHLVGCISGPSFAKDVIRGLPCAVVASAYDASVLQKIQDVFSMPTFRVYPNTDVLGVAFGGALKNIIAIACGISHGLNLGDSCRAALITRGLHEIRKLSVVCGCLDDTLTGLAGMGDLCLTCSSEQSRNFRFGYKLAQGLDAKQALEEIGMVVEGIYTCVSALQLALKHGVSMPITETIHQILYAGLLPKDAVPMLLLRTVKKEHL